MTESIATWLPSLLISLTAVGVFLYLARQSRSQIDRLKSALRRSSEQSIEHFLQRESRITLQRIQAQPAATESADPARLLPHMRRCWLEAEQRALVDNGQRDSDYDVLQNAVLPILRMTQRTETRSKPAWSDETSKEYLQKTREAATSQKQFIQEFKARAAKLGKKPKPASAETPAGTPQVPVAENFGSSIAGIESTNEELLKTIERLEKELAAARSRYDIVKDRLDALETIRTTRNAVAQAGARLSTPNEPNGSGDHALLEDMESAYVNAINEMKKMGAINREQRQLIMQMEKELSLLRKDTGEHSAAAELLDKLKLQLRDYENCTTILEMESDTLREQIQSLRRAIDREPIAEEPAAPVAVVPPPSANEQRDLLRLIAQIAAAENLEKAAQALVTWLGEQQIASVVFITGAREPVWASSEGRVDEHSKQLLKSMVPVAGQPISEVREGVMFIFTACRILLYGKGAFHERGSRLQLSLCDAFAAADHILHLFQDRTALQQHHQQRARLQQKIQSLLVQYNYIDTEFGRALAAFRTELEGYLQTADTSDVQRQCIDTMLADFDSQLDILSKTGKLVANGLKVSVQDLAKIEQTASP